MRLCALNMRVESEKLRDLGLRKEGFFTPSGCRSCSQRGKTLVVFIPQLGMSSSSLMGPVLSTGLGWRPLHVPSDLI